MENPIELTSEEKLELSKMIKSFIEEGGFDGVLEFEGIFDVDGDIINEDDVFVGNKDDFDWREN